MALHFPAFNFPVGLSCVVATLPRYGDCVTDLYYGTYYDQCPFLLLYSLFLPAVPCVLTAWPGEILAMPRRLSEEHRADDCGYGTREAF